MSHDFLFKYILTGDSSVGKTAILKRFTDKKYHHQIEATVGVDFKTKSVTIDDKEILLMSWDTAGQETFRAFTRSYYRGSAVAIIVYDITNRNSFLHTREWLQEVRDYSNNPNICVVLVGNKKDDEGERQVSEKEGRDFAEKNSLLFFEASAKSSENVEMIFTTSASIFYEKFKGGFVDFKSDAQGLTLGPKQMTFGGRGLCLC